MVSVGIIGVGGVGMAHVIASQKLGFGVKLMVDTDEEILRRIIEKDDWENTWEDFVETSPKQIDTIYSNSLQGVALSLIESLDIIVIATPPDSHTDIASSLRSKGYKGKILIEKPLFTNNSEYIRTQNIYDKQNTFLSCEWVFSNKINTLYKDGIRSIYMGYKPANTTDWQSLAVFDFIPHFCSILGNYSVTLTEATEDSFKGFIGDVQISGDRVGNCFKINDEDIYWEEDLFEKQLLNLHRGIGLPISEVENLHFELEFQLRKFGVI